MLTTASFFNSMTSAQIAKLFGAQPFQHGKREASQAAKAAAQPDTPPAGTVRDVAGETMRAIQALTLGNNSPSPASGTADAGFARYLLTGGFENGDTQTAILQGSANGSSYSFSFSANKPAEGDTRGVGHTSYSYSLTVDGHLLISGWIDGAQPVKMTLGFSYTEDASATAAEGGASVQAGAFRTTAGIIAVDTGAFASGNTSKGWPCPSPGLRISNSVTMVSGSYQEASLTTPASSSSYSQTAQRLESLDLQIAWGR